MFDVVSSRGATTRACAFSNRQQQLCCADARAVPVAVMPQRTLASQILLARSDEAVAYTSAELDAVAQQ